MNKKNVIKKGKIFLIFGSVFCILLNLSFISAITNCNPSGYCYGIPLNTCTNPNACSNSCHDCYQQHVGAAGCRQYAVGLVKCFIDSCKDGYADANANWADGCEQKVACGNDTDCNTPGACQVNPGHCINGNTVNAQCTYDFIPPKNVTDVSGNINNGFVYCANSITGRIGNAFNFNGVNAYVDLGNKESLKPKKVTISSWIKTSNTQNERFIAGFGNMSQGYWIGINRFGNVVFFVGTASGNSQVTVSNIINDNTWHHIAETYNGSTIKAYIDGILIFSDNSINGDIKYDGLSSFKIGQIDGLVSTGYWSGIIDEVKVWSRALKDNEILNEYQTGDFRATKICSLIENKIIENSDIQVKCLDTNKIISGNDLTINWALIFKNSLPFDRYQVYPYAKDNANPEIFKEGGNISFVNSSTPVTPTNKEPSLLPLYPLSGESFPNQEVNFSYGCSDPDGFGDLVYCNLFIFWNETYPSIPVFLSYSPNENKLVLYNETNNSAVAGNCTPGTNVIIENKNSKIDCLKISTLKSGTNVSLTFSIMFKESMTGKTYSLEPYAKDKAQPNHVVYEIKGNWIVKNFVLVNYPPVANSMNPSAGEFFINETSSFNFDYSDPNGFTDITSAYVIMDSNISDIQKVLAIYYPVPRRIEIRDDLNNSRVAGNCTIGENLTIGNYYTNISCLNSRVSGSGEIISVYLSFIFKDKFMGQRKIFIKAIDANGTSSNLKEVGNISLVKRMPSNCTDSDGGKDYSIKGITNASQGSLTDYCINTTTLKEYYCNSSGVAAYVSYRCPQNCSNGKCIEVQITTPGQSNAAINEPDRSEISTSTEPETSELDKSQVRGKTTGEMVLWAIIWTIIIIFCIILIYLIYSLNKKRALKKKFLNRVSNPVVRQMPPGFYRPPFRR